MVNLIPRVYTFTLWHYTEANESATLKGASVAIGTHLNDANAIRYCRKAKQQIEPEANICVSFRSQNIFLALAIILVPGFLHIDDSPSKLLGEWL